MCEMVHRLNIVGLIQGNTCDWPVSQAALGEALGLSVVHVNRTLQKLRKLDLIELRTRRLTVLDWDRLAAIGDFDPTYLHGPTWAYRLGNRENEHA